MTDTLPLTPQTLSGFIVDGHDLTTVISIAEKWPTPTSYTCKLMLYFEDDNEKAVITVTEKNNTEAKATVAYYQALFKAARSWKHAMHQKALLLEGHHAALQEAEVLGRRNLARLLAERTAARAQLRALQKAAERLLNEPENLQKAMEHLRKTLALQKGEASQISLPSIPASGGESTEETW